MLVRKVSPQFFLLLSGARSIDPEDMPALFGIIGALCRRAGIGQVPSLYFLPSGVPTAFATGVGDQSVIVVSSGLLRLLMTRELTGVLAHEIAPEAQQRLDIAALREPHPGLLVDDVVKAQLQPLMFAKGAKGVGIGETGIEQRQHMRHTERGVTAKLGHAADRDAEIDESAAIAHKTSPLPPVRRIAQPGAAVQGQ